MHRSSTTRICAQQEFPASSQGQADHQAIGCGGTPFANAWIFEGDTRAAKSMTASKSACIRDPGRRQRLPPPMLERQVFDRDSDYLVRKMSQKQRSKRDKPPHAGTDHVLHRAPRTMGQRRISLLDRATDAKGDQDFQVYLVLRVHQECRRNQSAAV